MMAMKYLVIVEKSENGFGAYVPDLPGCVAAAETRREVVALIQKEFGAPFALAVTKLPVGSWQGPIESGFGWHLVFLNSVIPGRVPTYEEVDGNVRTAWFSEQKTLALDKAYKELRASYKVLLPAPP